MHLWIWLVNRRFIGHLDDRGHLVARRLSSWGLMALWRGSWRLPVFILAAGRRCLLLIRVVHQFKSLKFSSTHDRPHQTTPRLLLLLCAFIVQHFNLAGWWLNTAWTAPLTVNNFLARFLLALKVFECLVLMGFVLLRCWCQAKVRVTKVKECATTAPVPMMTSFQPRTHDHARWLLCKWLVARFLHYRVSYLLDWI